MSSTESEELHSIEQKMAALEQQVVGLMAAVQDAQRLGGLGVLAATVAHEINNILTPIQGYARSALARPGDTELAALALQRAAEGAERGSQIARSILALAGEATAEDGGGVATRVAEAVAEAIEHSRQVLDRYDVDVRLEVEQQALAAIARAGLVQVVQNLLLNAAHAMRERGGVIEVRAAVAPSGAEAGERDNITTDGPTNGMGAAAGGGPWVELLISDNGPGIPAGVRERLFRPFATASAGAAGRVGAAGQSGSAPGGHGLGLSICKGLVEAAGGRISVQTAVGEGTTFRIVLPGAA